MKRRGFITLLGGTAARPLAAKEQQPERVRRIGVLMNIAEDDAQAQSRMEAFLHGLQPLGWTVGRNLPGEGGRASESPLPPRFQATSRNGTRIPELGPCTCRLRVSLLGVLLDGLEFL
jgi:hypothetical protein